MPKTMLNCRPKGQRQLEIPLKTLLDEAETGLLIVTYDDADGCTNMFWFFVMYHLFYDGEGLLSKLLLDGFSYNLQEVG
jgi:hypothetical protein